MKSTNRHTVFLSVFTAIIGTLLVQFFMARPALQAAPVLHSPSYRVVLLRVGSTDEIQGILDKNAKDGWHLHSIAEQKVVFERD